MLPPNTFHGHTALVTGGSNGIGLAIALSLSRLGANVAIVGRDSGRLDAAAEELSRNGSTAAGYSVDVRDADGVRETIGEISRKLGTISLLVNNAAGNFRVDPLDLSPNGWRAVVDIVLNGTWNVTQAVGRNAIEAGIPLSVVNIGTTAALTGSSSTIHSASAKSGVLTMTKSLAAAWAQHGIRLNTLTPGLTEGTGGADVLYGTPDELKRHLREIPLGRIATKDEISNACTYLLSDFAGYITGTNLIIDGGRQLAAK
ncbi:NAD(P)-dependent dehydrogenase (short-subunit alcohol dehydrogenase family) [Arthrobacter sp. CAN_A214]|uniref:SDR family oxidoreductase n=1 Tax=Arthrobacter sp. CAN_A214 TaxID=2787720 RepID=UPI0018CA956B